MTGPITAFFTALVGSAILSRPKLPELKPDKLKALSADFVRLRVDRNRLLEENTRLRVCLDAARADRDQSDAQLRTLRAAHDALLRMFVEEQRSRLQVERDLIEAEARLESYRSNAHRSQAPWHLPIAPLTEGPVPAPLTSEQAQRLSVQALEQIKQMSQMREPPLMPVISDSLQVAMQQMDAFICNCAPGRHELFVREDLNVNMVRTDEIEGDDTL
jgi:hypothetical protein